MKLKFGGWLIIVGLLAFMGMHAQTPAGAPVNVYQPTPDQAKDLRIAQLTKAVAQQQAQSAINQYNATVSDELAVANKIKADNKWPETVSYSVQTGVFNAPPPAPPKPEISGSGTPPTPAAK